MGIIRPCRSICSAFRAQAQLGQTIQANELTVVSFADEIIDLNEEYDQATSTFTADEDGVYSFMFSLQLSAGTNHRVDIYLVVNDSLGNPQTTHLFDVAERSLQQYHLSTILSLRENDTVNVQIQIPQLGTVIDRFFVAARHPSFVGLG